MTNYAIVLSINYPNLQWQMADSFNYETLIMLDGSSKPSKQELDSLSVESEIKHNNFVINEQRKGAYEQISDPVFFKWQRGEATQEEWLAAIQQVKDMYPKVVT
jgi:hypothetical protein